MSKKYKCYHSSNRTIFCEMAIPCRDCTFFSPDYLKLNCSECDRPGVAPDNHATIGLKKNYELQGKLEAAIDFCKSIVEAYESGVDMNQWCIDNIEYALESKNDKS